MMIIQYIILFLCFIINLSNASLFPSKNFLYKILNSNDRGAGNNITFIINEATDKNGKLDVDYAKVLLKYSAKYSHAPYYKELFSAFKAFAKYRNVNSFDQLNLQQKRDVMRKIIKHQNIITQSVFHEAIKSKIKSADENTNISTKKLAEKNHYEKLFCAFEKSNCIHFDKGCICDRCEVFKKYGLNRKDFCLKNLL